jgi:hypothetical protein
METVLARRRNQSLFKFDIGIIIIIKTRDGRQRPAGRILNWHASPWAAHPHKFVLGEQLRKMKLRLRLRLASTIPSVIARPTDDAHLSLVVNDNNKKVVENNPPPSHKKNKNKMHV